MLFVSKMLHRFAFFTPERDDKEPLGTLSKDDDDGSENMLKK